ncbi:hypothetical protein S245_051429 [Arachis hypogaea]
MASVCTELKLWYSSLEQSGIQTDYFCDVLCGRVLNIVVSIYFVWLDEVEEKTRNMGTEVVSKERPLKQSYQKMNELTECATKLEEDVQQLQKTVNMIRGEIKLLRIWLWAFVSGWVFGHY